MTTKQENQLAVVGTIEKRVKASESLLERMGITPEQYERVVLNALIRNPQLADCDRTSMDIAVADCIQAGLLPDGRQAAIVPFRPKNAPAALATVIPMIEGRLMLARRATPGLALRVRVVYEEDEWDYSEGLHVTLKHKPNPTGGQAGRVRNRSLCGGAPACGTTTGVRGVRPGHHRPLPPFLAV